MVAEKLKEGQHFTWLLNRVRRWNRNKHNKNLYVYDI